MTTKQQIIQDAYTAGGLASYAFDLSPEEIAYAGRLMDSMLAQWGVTGTRLGYNPGGEASDESGLPDWAVDAVATNLGLRLCGVNGKAVTPELRSAAAVGLNMVQGQAMTIPERARNAAYTPAGAGNRGYDPWVITLPETAEQLDTGKDGPLDLGA